MAERRPPDIDEDDIGIPTAEYDDRIAWRDAVRACAQTPPDAEQIDNTDARIELQPRLAPTVRAAATGPDGVAGNVPLVGPSGMIAPTRQPGIGQSSFIPLFYGHYGCWP